MRKIPNYFALRAFEAAARHESFALGARELNLTPSAISHQVRELEEHFGIPLFVRANRRVEATPEGRRLFESLARTFDALEAACADIGTSASEQVLSVHCAPSLAVKWLGPRLPRFMQAHPHITIRLSSGPEPLDLGRAREVDVAISYGFARAGTGIDVTPLGLERIVPLCSPSLLDATLAPAAQLASLPLISGGVAVMAHVAGGHWAATQFLRGYVWGLFAKMAFGAVFAVAARPFGVASALLIAGACAVLVATVRWPSPRIAPLWPRVAVETAQR